MRGEKFLVAADRVPVERNSVSVRHVRITHGASAARFQIHLRHSGRRSIGCLSKHDERRFDTGFTPRHLRALGKFSHANANAIENVPDGRSWFARHFR
jgi:hypothetical protein